MAAPAPSWRSWPRSGVEPTVGDGDDDQGDEDLQRLEPEVR
jgi:hypothetical protein